jgi:hypothetical protein
VLEKGIICLKNHRYYFRSLFIDYTVYNLSSLRQVDSSTKFILPFFQTCKIFIGSSLQNRWATLLQIFPGFLCQPSFENPGNRNPLANLLDSWLLPFPEHKSNARTTRDYCQISCKWVLLVLNTFSFV